MDLKEVSTLNLVNRLNEIMVEENSLDIEHNLIVEELQSRLPNLKDDKNIHKKTRKREVMNIWQSK